MALKIAVGLKWVADLDSVDVDPISGAVDAGRLLFLLDPGAESALATALALRAEVTVYTVGGAEMEPALRVALAAGVTRAFRLADDARPAVTAAQLARALEADGPFDLVLLGTRSFDRGSGEVPSLLANELGWPVVTDVDQLQAAAEGSAGSWEAVRETERGAKEIVAVTGPAVFALQADVARLPTASLPAFMKAQQARLDVRENEMAPLATDPTLVERTLLPQRPRTLSTRARPPVGTPDQRLAAITGGAAGTRTRGKMIEGTPAEAAEAIVTFLRERHLLDAPS
jgi:electron transfer flavoprotein beta subunit